MCLGLTLERKATCVLVVSQETINTHANAAASQVLRNLSHPSTAVFSRLHGFFFCTLIFDQLLVCFFVTFPVKFVKQRYGLIGASPFFG